MGQNLNIIMGTWAEGSFGNDAAGDWVIELRETPTYEFIRETIQASIDIPDDASINEPAVAAAEVLCILDGKLPGDYEEVSHNLEPAIAILKQQKMPSDLKKLAIKCLDMILSDSELKDLWEDEEEWLAQIKNLISRLQN